MVVKHEKKRLELAFSKASRKTSGSYGVEGMCSEYHGGLYHLLSSPAEMLIKKVII